jgi:hypothetical protein
LRKWNLKVKRMEKRRDVIFNYAFLFSLVLLALNDHVLKAAYHNPLTGKLSDFAGMVVLPLLLAYLFPKLRVNAIWLSMALFAFWKLPVSQPVFDALNTVLPIAIGRVVDYTDFIAFLIVPLPYFIIKGNTAVGFLKIRKFQLSPAWLVIPSLFVVIATSPPPYRFEKLYRPATGNIDLKSKNIKVYVKLSPDEILEKLSEAGVVYQEDKVNNEYSTRRREHTINDRFYKIKTLIIDKDTLKDIQFSIIPRRKGTVWGSATKVYLNSLTIEKDLTDEQVKKRMARYYKRALKKYFNYLDK